MDLKHYVDVLTQHTDDHKRPYEMALSDFLDYCLGLFSTEAFSAGVASYRQHIECKLGEDPTFYSLAVRWLSDIADGMNRGEWIDVFGMLYEDLYLSRGKASKTGQFFTPHSLSDLVSSIITDDKDHGTVNDCAAGSGRLLLSHFMNHTKDDHSAASRFRYLAQDLDPVACKMCALNMMAHGMYGRVECRDTLDMSTPSVTYYINEVRFPFVTPYYSVRAELPHESEK